MVISGTCYSDFSSLAFLIKFANRNSIPGSVCSDAHWFRYQMSSANSHESYSSYWFETQSERHTSSTIERNYDFDTVSVQATCFQTCLHDWSRDIWFGRSTGTKYIWGVCVHHAYYISTKPQMYWPCKDYTLSTCQILYANPHLENDRYSKQINVHDM